MDYKEHPESSPHLFSHEGQSAAKREPEMLAPLGKNALFTTACAKRRPGPGSGIILHDGPPYANGQHTHGNRPEQDSQGRYRKVPADGRLMTRSTCRAGTATACP